MSIFKKHKTIADRSAGDRERHRKKIEKAIKEGIHDLVAEESIIGESGKKKFRIPVRGVKEHKFVYGENGGKRVGSGEGNDLSRGQVIGKKKKGKGNGGKPEKPGNEKGEEFYEVELTLEQVAEYLFKDLELPNFEKKKNAQVVSKKIKRKGYRTKGIRPRLDKKKTALERIKRMKKEEFTGKREADSDDSFSYNERDLRYKHYAVKEKKTSNAVIFFLMDISGSMGKQKKFLSRSFFFLLYHFIRSRYDKVDIAFVAYEAEAYEVDEKSFFERGSSGGTIASTGIKMVNEIIDSRYHPSSWNIYAFHASDGDNWPTDNDNVREQMSLCLPKMQFYGYCEVEPSTERMQWLRESSLGTTFENISHDKLKTSRISSKEDIWLAFNTFFKGGELS
ncbi:MAG: sporulation protein YhbH [Legionellales bacterium]|nr:sporulation protein YhbH [Legionellales bacterium]